MTPHPRAKELFLQALELYEGERAALLERLAREDSALSTQVLELLGAHAGTTADALERVPAALESLLGAKQRQPDRRLGDYELLEELGSGASGSVWRARQVSLDRIVALKVLRAGRLAGARELERLRAEAEAVARLDHPHIVPVHEVGEHDGQAFFSMKWTRSFSAASASSISWTEAGRARTASSFTPSSPRNAGSASATMRSSCS